MTNLSQKLASLSIEIDGYIAPARSDLADIEATTTAGNAILADILEAIQALLPIIQQAADCACAAANALEGAPWNEEPPPILGCEDEEANPSDLTFGDPLLSSDLGDWGGDGPPTGDYIFSFSAGPFNWGAQGAAGLSYDVSGPFWMEIEVNIPADAQIIMEYSSGGAPAFYSFPGPSTQSYRIFVPATGLNIVFWWYCTIVPYPGAETIDILQDQTSFILRRCGSGVG